MGTPDQSARGEGRGGGGLWSRLLGRGDRSAAAMDTFRRLALQLEQDLPGEGGGRVVLVASPDQDGVAREACEHLCEVLTAEMAKRVLLIDAAPSGVSNNGHAPAGLAAVLRDGPGALDAAMVTDAGGKRSRLESGAGLGPPLLLGSAYRKDVIDRARSRFDFVLVHAAPVLRDSTGLALGPMADCVLLVAMEGRTLLEHLDAARKLVANRTQAKLGVLLVSPASSGRGII